MSDINTFKVSVIIPVYNVEKYLPECLDSVLSQTLREIEVLCVDNNSPDHSAELIKDYVNRDRRVRYFCCTKKGAAYARNMGLENANGEFIAFMDADDVYPSNGVLELLYNKANEHDVQIAGGQFQTFDGDKVKDASRFADFDVPSTGCVIEYKDFCDDWYYQAYIYSKSMLDDGKIHFSSYFRGEDPPFFVRAMIAAKRFFIVPEPSYRYRVSHKELIWTSQIANDIVRELTDLFMLSKEHKLPKLHERAYQHITKGYYARSISGTVEAGNPEFLAVFNELCDAIDDSLLIRIPGASAKKVREVYAKRIHSFGMAFANERYRKDNPPKVSVIIPVYNVEKYLPECLNSAINQTLKDIEIICINDGSTDGSLKILQDYALIDKRIKIIDKSNEDVTLARKRGVQEATGDYITFIDSDDYITNTYCEKLLTSCLICDTEMSVCEWWDDVEFPLKPNDYALENSLIIDNSEICNANITRSFIPQMRVWMGVTYCKLYSRRLIETVDWDISNYRITNDELISIQTSAATNGLSFVQEQLYYYRRGIVDSKVYSYPAQNIFQGELIPMVQTAADVYEKTKAIFENYEIGYNRKLLSTRYLQMLCKELKNLYKSGKLNHANLQDLVRQRDLYLPIIKREGYYCGEQIMLIEQLFDGEIVWFE
jgi:glycosyltransferase involved in cell wall biosynthesis